MAILAVTSYLLIFVTTTVYSYSSNYNKDPPTECTYAPLDSNYVTYCDLNNTLRAELKAKFDAFETFHDLIGKLARLIFHDCFGPKENDPFTLVPAICDGCIDWDNPKHAGLPHEIEKMEYIYIKPAARNGSNWNTRMSRADFWAACATIAIQEASWQPNSSWRMLPVSYPVDELPYIPFYIGREDCSASPDINIDNYNNTKWINIDGTDTEIVAKSFGEATGGFDDNFALFQEGFGLGPREYVALLGVHTLGRIKSETSGFGDEIGKPWVEAWDVLDNAFYQMLMDNEQREKKLNWIQHRANDGNSEFFEWRDTLRGADGPTRFIMLNSDMALVKNLDELPNGATLDPVSGECPYKSYDDLYIRPASRQYVVEFANNNKAWLTAFGNVFDRMIRAGYDNVNRVPRDRKLSILAEEWYLKQWKRVNEFGVPECYEIINFTDPYGPYGPYGAKKWEGGQDNLIRNHLEDTLWAFEYEYQQLHEQCLINTDDGEINFLNYYYDWYFDGSYLDIHIIACCGEEGAVFPANYTPEYGYEYVGFGDAFVGSADEDLTETEIVIKHVIVWSIVAVICTLCIIGGTVFYKKYKNKKLALERETAEMTQPISPGQKDKKDKKKNKAKKETTVDVRTPMMDSEGGDGINVNVNANGNGDAVMPSNNPYVIANNSTASTISTASFDQHK